MEGKKEIISFEFKKKENKTVVLSIVLIPALVFVIVFHAVLAVKVVSSVMLVYNLLFLIYSTSRRRKNENYQISFSEEGIKQVTNSKEYFFLWDTINEVYYSSFFGKEYILIPLKGTLDLKARTTIRDRFHFEINLFGLIINRVVCHDVIRLCGKYCEPFDKWKQLTLLLKEKTHVVVDR